MVTKLSEIKLFNGVTLNTAPLLGTEKLPKLGKYEVPLSESKWRALFEKLDTFEFFPPMQSEYLRQGDYMYFSYLAADYAKPINLG